MRIPKTYKGIPVVVQKKTPKIKERTIATSYVTRDGKPIIKVWSKNKRHLTPYVLKHESAHIKLGHHKPPYPKTVGGYWSREIKADRVVYKGKQIPSSRLGDCLDNLIVDFGKRDEKVINNNPKEAAKYFIEKRKSFGFSKDEMERAIKYRDTHRRKHIKTD